MIAEIIPKIAGQFDNKESHYYPRPSVAGPERCTRQMVYWGMNIPRSPLPGRSILVFDDSRWHEDLTADWIRRSVFHLHSEQLEVKITAPGYLFNLTGHIDGIITDVTAVDYLWEHKAINHFTWQKYHDGAIPLDYVTQCCLYIRGLKATYGTVDKAILLVKNKNTASYLEFLIAYNFDDDSAVIVSITDSNGKVKELNERIDKICISAFEKLRLVNEYINKLTLPKRDYFIGENWQCEYCGWCKTCWAGYQNEFNELKTNAMLPDDVADMLRYYKELGAQKTDIEKEYREMASKIKDTMKQIGAREGRAGEYIARLKLIESDRIDKELLSETELQKATVKSISERLYISAPKKEVING